MREPNIFNKRKYSAVNFAFSLHNGIPTTQIHTLKRKDDSFWFPFRRVAVSLRCRTISRFQYNGQLVAP
jgi:hypothetical protein